MKKSVVLIAVLFVGVTSFAIVNPLYPPIRASDVLIPVNQSGQTISLLELSRVKVGTLESLTGRRMKFFERISFKLAQGKLRKEINNDGTFKKKRFNRFFSRYGGETGFHLGGFALGFFLSLVGVLIAYLLNDDYKRNRVNWAWTGFSAAIGILLAVSLLINPIV